MKPSRLLFYALILLAVSSYIFFIEHGYKERRQTQDVQDAKFLGLDKEKITQVNIQGTTGINVELRKPASDWVIVSPIKARADEFTVNALLTSISQAAPERVISGKDVKWDDYGFEKQTLSVTLGTDQGRNHRLVFGAQNPSKSSYYAKLDDDKKLYLVADTLKNALDKSLFDLRDKTVMAFAPSEIEKLVIQKKGVKNEFTREGVSQWNIVNPEQFRVKNVAISTFLRKLSHLTALEIIDDPETDTGIYGLNPPPETISIFGKDFNQTLHVGTNVKSEADSSPKRGHYVKVDGSDTVFVIDSPAITDFRMDADVLEDKSLLSLNTQEVSKIEVSFDHRKVIIYKSEDKKWNLEEQRQAEPVREWQVTGILWKLRDLDYLSLTSPIPSSLPDLGLSDPQLVITLGHGDASNAKVLRFCWANKTEANSPENHADQNSPETRQGVDEKSPQGNTDIFIPATVNVLVEPSFYPNTLFQVDGVLVRGLIDDILTLINKKQSDRKEG